MGVSSSGVAALTMAWFHPERHHRVLAYSPTMVNQPWPHDGALSGGAWQYHDEWPGPAHAPRAVDGPRITPATCTTGVPLITNAPCKPIRYWFETGDRDLFDPAAALADGMHDWMLANEHAAKVLGAADYQFVFAPRSACRQADAGADPARSAGAGLAGLPEAAPAAMR